MNLASFFRANARRWYVVVAGIIVVILGCYAVYTHVGATYERDSTTVLIPGTQSFPVGSNPYLYIGGLSQASDVLVGALNAETVQDSVTTKYPGAKITVSRDPSTSAPIIAIAVTAPTDGAAAGALRAMNSSIAPTLLALQNQAGVSSAALMTAVRVTSDPTSQVSQKSRIEMLGLVAIGGIVVTLLLAALIDSLILSRLWSRRRRPRAQVAVPVPVSVPVTQTIIKPRPSRAPKPASASKRTSKKTKEMVMTSTVADGRLGR